MSQALLLRALRKALVSLIWTLGLGLWGRDIPVLGEGRALGTKQWRLSLFLSQCSQPSHRSEHALGDDAETSPSSCLRCPPPWRGPDLKAAGSLVPLGNTGQFLFIT